jgi:hypothetical protein
MSGNIITNVEELNDPHQWNGLKLEMSDSNKNIIAKIDNISRCCEDWGHNISFEENDEVTNKKLKDFIGAKFISVEVIEYDEDTSKERYEVTMDVKIITDRGNIIIQFYNEHNGYYAHDVSIQIEGSVKIIKL